MSIKTMMFYKCNSCLLFRFNWIVIDVKQLSKYYRKNTSQKQQFGIWGQSFGTYTTTQTSFKTINSPVCDVIQNSPICDVIQIGKNLVTSWTMSFGLFCSLFTWPSSFSSTVSDDPSKDDWTIIQLWLWPGHKEQG